MLDARVAACLLLAMVLGCVPRPSTCGGPIACAGDSACVAGRCQRTGSVAAVQSAKRLLVDPTAVAFVRRGEAGSGGALPAIFLLGRAADGDAHLLLRFNVPLPPNVTVLEAYLLLQRSEVVDADPVPVSLHAERIVDLWDPRSVSWAREPRVEDTRSPRTTVLPTAGSLVRVDVRDLVQRWRARDARDQGIAVMAENRSPTGVAFALLPGEPRLELYVK